MKYLERLINKIENDNYFKELLFKAEEKSANDFLGIDIEDLSEKEFTDLLRFADILSHSHNSNHLNWAYKIVSLTKALNYYSEVFSFYSDSILTKLGNFPALKFLNNSNTSINEGLPLERKLDNALKQTIQKVPESDDIFTDDQYVIFEALKNNNHYSFSGPTSLGKSYIFESFIKYLIFEKNISDNIVIIVPTRALINQVFLKLKKDIDYEQSNYKILCHPVIPSFNIKPEDNYIFIFTPERFLSYIYEPSNPRIEYMFIDEAQKITTQNDSRSPLYYDAIFQAERKSIKLFFASPNIPNPDVFLKLFEKSTDEAIAVNVSPVAQSRYFLDFIQKEAFFISEFEGLNKINYDNILTNFNNCLLSLGANDCNIIYCNTVADTISYALNFSLTLPDAKCVEIDEVTELVKEHLHKDYFLINCLNKGVAFHFGKLPQRIRIRIEELFQKKIVKFLFCTSTLLEGVNLPAKNLFILSNAIGTSKFTSIDFWNLAGRAGRLTKELSGNIICVRNEQKGNRWDRPELSLLIVLTKSIPDIDPILISGRKNFYKNLELSLLNKPFTVKDYSRTQKDIWDHYANITAIHEIREEQSILKSNFIKKSLKGQNALEKVLKNNIVDQKILSAFSSIKIKYQNKILKKINNLPILTNEVDYNNVLNILEVLSEFYSWHIEEAKGRNPMYKSQNSIKYYAKIMTDWINSKPLKQMIESAITYYLEKGEIWIINKYEVFERTPKYINIAINELISDIDNVLRFKLMTYFDNYYALLDSSFGSLKSGVNWAKYLEYGTINQRVIELQNSSIPRHLAIYLIKNFDDCLIFENESLIDIRIEQIKKSINTDDIHYKELEEILW